MTPILRDITITLKPGFRTYSRLFNQRLGRCTCDVNLNTASMWSGMEYRYVGGDAARRLGRALSMCHGGVEIGPVICIVFFTCQCSTLVAPSQETVRYVNVIIAFDESIYRLATITHIYLLLDLNVKPSGLLICAVAKSCLEKCRSIGDHISRAYFGVVRTYERCTSMASASPPVSTLSRA